METISQTCQKCGGFIFPPYYWHSTVPPTMCSCPKDYQFRAPWECPRCHTIHSPYKDSCDCTITYGYMYTDPHL